MPRLSLPETPTPEQAEVIAEVVAGKRGKVPGPMIGWLPNPELARRAQHLGALLRYDTSLEPVLSELAILICGRHWTSHYEWTAHKRIALEAGLDPRTIADVAERKPAPYLRNEREAAVFAVASTLMAQTRIDDATYAYGIATLGERGMVDLVGILGYYSMVALTLNAFDLGLPDAFAPELDPPVAGATP
jgi:4-carboxymuconolactone decarboxylase